MPHGPERLPVAAPARHSYTRQPAASGRSADSPAAQARPGGALKLTAKLESDLKQLEKELRVDLPREIKRALAMGDLRENAEYHAALERQSFVKARIGHIQTRLAEISRIDRSEIPRDRIGLGSLVQVLDVQEDRELTYEFVLPEEADPANGKVSLSSPLGRGFSGRREGDALSIEVPSGRRSYEILSVKTIHEREE